MTAPAIQASAVSLRFGGLTALDDVTLAIAPRELVGLIGPNGAGKTSLFNVISGVTQPTTGAVAVGGIALTGRPAHDFARHGVARTFQTPRVFADMSVAENVRFGLEFAGRRRPENPALPGRVDAILALLGLDAQGERPAGSLPPGARRRLEIGMALSARPAVLLLDEVAAGLSESEVAETARLIRRCRDELGLAVVWVEHAVRHVMALAERVVVLHQGRIIADGAPAAVARDTQVVAAYLGGSPA